MRTKTIVAKSGEEMDKQLGEYTERTTQRDPDEIHIAFDSLDGQLVALLVWRSASKAALSPGGRRR